MIAGLLLGLGASMCWAIANVAIQRSTRAVGIVPALVWSQIVGGTGLLALAAVLDRPTEPWTAATIAWAGLGGVATCLAYLGLFYATAHGRLSIVVPIVSSWALLSAAIGVGLLGQRAGAATLAGALLVVAGVVLVARSARDDTSTARPTERRALWAAVAGAVGFGTLIPAIDQIAPAAGRLGAVALVFAVDLALAVPIACARRLALVPRGGGGRAALLTTAVFEAAGFACASLGGARAPLAIVAPAASVSAPLTVLWAWLVLGERPGGLAASGAVLSAAGVLLLAG